MNTRRAPAGARRLAAAGALALLASLFFPWYSAEQLVALPTGDVSVPGESTNAWAAFSIVDLILALSALLTLALVAAKAYELPLQLPAPDGLLITAAGCLSVLLILVRLVVPPEVTTIAGPDVEVETGRRIGILVGLLSAFVMTAGGYLTLQNEPRR
jgi:hypothetical protein